MGHPSSLDWMAALALTLLAIWLFRGHFFGETLWIGNPDRLNNDLKILGHYVSGLNGGHIAAWNEHEMMGYDSFVLPYTFPNPLVYLVALFGAGNLYVVMGYVAIAMLAMAGLAAYWFLRAVLPAGIPCLVGAICYEFSSLTVLKDSQNDMSFAVFIVIPLLALAVRRIRGDTKAWCFLILSVLLGCMLSLMFLQKAAYALMLIGAYAGWRSLAERSWRPALVFTAAFAAALMFSLPRFVGIAAAMHEYARAASGWDLRNFDELYRLQNIHPYEILRWLDDTIFGRSPSDARLLQNNINLTEGFLLYTSAVVPMLLMVGVARSRWTWLKAFGPSKSETAFFFWALLACISVVVFKPVQHALFLLFLKTDFTHARILIAALLPLSALVATALAEMSPQASGPRSPRALAAGLIAGLLAAWAIDAVAARFPGVITVDHILTNLRTFEFGFEASHLRVDALIRIELTALFFVALLPVLRARGGLWPYAAYACVAALLAGQCLLAANQRVNGPEVFNFARPFHRGDFYQAKREEFSPPGEAQLRALHERVEPRRYRVALVCDPEIADGFCAGHVPEFWGLRAIDGYYGFAVPARLHALPWPDVAISLRTISFNGLDTMPWDLLGFLNVRSALVVRDGLFRNIVRDGDRIVGRPDPAAFELVRSRARVTPRAFFAAAVEPVSSLREAVDRIFRPGGIVDPVVTSFVEGIGEARHFESGGTIDLEGGGDLLELRFAASPAERFLVLNELYYPGWRADVDGRELPILATDAVMRGVPVPPGADHLRLRYVPYVATPVAWGLRAAALAAMLTLFLALRRRSGAGA